MNKEQIIKFVNSETNMIAEDDATIDHGGHLGVVCYDSPVAIGFELVTQMAMDLVELEDEPEDMFESLQYMNQLMASAKVDDKVSVGDGYVSVLYFEEIPYINPSECMDV